jgi:hypothetical protein
MRSAAKPEGHAPGTPRNTRQPSSTAISFIVNACAVVPSVTSNTGIEAGTVLTASRTSCTRLRSMGFASFLRAEVAPITARLPSPTRWSK